MFPGEKLLARKILCRNNVSHDALKMAADEEPREELTRFAPYEDPPRGAFSKISSFFSRWTRPSRSVPATASPDTQNVLPLEQVNAAGSRISELPSGQMSVQSVPPMKQSAGGVSPSKLRKALIKSIKTEEEEVDKVRVWVGARVHAC